MSQATQFFTHRGLISAPPCWRPNCSNPATRNAGVQCSVYQQHVKLLGEGSKDFIRAMRATGPFVAQSCFAYLNELTKQLGSDIPVDYPWPPQRCVFQSSGCKVGQRCRKACDLAVGALIPELQEDFVGPIKPHIWWDTEPSPPQKRACEEQLEEGLRGQEMERRREKRRKEEEENVARRRRAEEGMVGTAWRRMCL